jgi:hypothetical protein
MTHQSFILMVFHLSGITQTENGVTLGWENDPPKSYPGGIPSGINYWEKNPSESYPNGMESVWFGKMTRQSLNRMVFHLSGINYREYYPDGIPSTL